MIMIKAFNFFGVYSFLLIDGTSKIHDNLVCGHKTICGKLSKMPNVLKFRNNVAELNISLTFLSSWNKYYLQQLLGRTTRPFRYDLNQIPSDYKVEVRNRFKGLDLIEYLMNYGQRFMTLFRRQGLRPSPRKRNAKKQNGCLRRS